MRPIAKRALFLLLLASPLFPQEQPKPAPDSISYRVEFTIRDAADPMSRAGRKYGMAVDSAGRASVRAGSKIPIASGPNTSYYDIGVNIDCRAREAGGKVMLSAEVDLTTVNEAEKTPGAAAAPPAIAQSRLIVSAFVTAGKPAVLATIDDPVTKRKLEVEAVVTRMN